MDRDNEDRSAIEELVSVGEERPAMGSYDSMTAGNTVGTAPTGGSFVERDGEDRGTIEEPVSVGEERPEMGSCDSIATGNTHETAFTGGGRVEKDSVHKDACWELTPEDEAYPESLRTMDDPPDRLYGRGDPAVLSTMCLAVVGARQATPYGIAIASMAGRVAAESGITVVSGGAMGCDAEAARGALDAGGKTIVVSGVGADRIYPASSEDVYRRAVRQGGAIVSLAPWGSTPQRFAFPLRNRIIAALATAVLVSEAGQRSGTTSTAMAATEMGREVYAAPGSIFSPKSQGSNALIRDGAHIITCESDLEMLISRDFGVLRLVREQLPTPRGRVLSALFASPMRADDLASQLGENPLEILRILADYEVRGVVELLVDGRYSPTKEAFQSM